MSLESFGRHGEDAIPAIGIEQVLEPHSDLIDRIRLCYGVDQATFERDLLALIRRYAEFVHLLPATPDNYCRAPGGLLRLGLEVAFFSLQGTDGRIFSGRSTITTRRHLEPRWRHATFIAGLCCELHSAVSHVVVTDGAGAEWPPYLLPLSTWLVRRRASRFFQKWVPHAQEVRALVVLALSHVVPGQILQDLANSNSIVVPHMIAAISGTPIFRDRNILDDLVRRSLSLVIERHMRATEEGNQKAGRVTHLEPYIVDALRRLVKDNPAWKPNGDKSRVWFGSDGLFIVWPHAAADIQKVLEAAQLSGVPKGPDAILQLLVAAQLCEPSDAVCNTWQICPPDAKSSIAAIKIAAPAMLFGTLDPQPQPLTLSLRAVTASAVPIGASLNATADSADTQQLPLELAPASEANLANTGAGAPKFVLEAPMRLNPAVRETLARIVETLNHGGFTVAACTISSGVFVPLVEFERRNVEPSVALRALSELNMLVRPNGAASLTITRDFGGDEKPGLVLHPRFVAGLDLENFKPSD